MAEMAKLKHVGIILDGNRRWAKQRGKTAIAGHNAGYKALKEVLSTVRELDIEYLSVFVFSTENWDRSKEEVDGLMNLFRSAFKKDLKELVKEDVRIAWLGSERNVPRDMIKMLRELEQQTKDATSGTLCICFNYGGRLEVAEAIEKSGGDASAEAIRANLYHPEVPDVDLIIRTSGEKRLSNFMLWRAAYSELAFTKTLWPDFTGDELKEIVEEYYGRARRFGS